MLYTFQERLVPCITHHVSAEIGAHVWLQTYIQQSQYLKVGWLCADLHSQNPWDIQQLRVLPP